MDATYPELGIYSAPEPLLFDTVHRFTGPNAYSYAVANPVSYVDPNGQSPVYVAGGFVLVGGAWILCDGGAEAVSDFKENYDEMKFINVINADKYYHCIAHCKASKRGLYGGKIVSKLTSFWREYTDRFRKHDSYEDILEDFDANECGQDGAANGLPCNDVCETFRPKVLPPASP